MSRRPLRELLPLRPGTAAGVLAAGLTLACAEFVRSGLYGAYLTQVIDTKFHLPVAVAGAAWTSHMVADTLMRGPAGGLIQRFGPRRVALAGAAVSLLALSLLPLAHSAWMLLLVAAIHGIGFSPMWPAAMNLTADAARPGYEGRVLTVVSTSVMPLTGLGFMVYGALAHRPDVWAITIALVMLSLSLLLSLLLPARRHIEAAAEGGERRSSPRALLPALLPLLPAALMQTLTQALIGNWLFRMAPKFGLEYWDLVALLVVGGAVAFGSMPFTGRIADRGRARLAVTVGYALVALGLAGFAFMPPVWTLFLLAACTGLGYAFLTPGWAALVAQTLPEAQRPAAWGVLMTVENGGFAAGPLLGGLALQQAGVRGPFALGAVLALITSLGYVLFRRHFQSRPPGVETPVKAGGAD
ncbi:MFS transporter [Deinococcus malanensis]|uniref:MFS transporter n=1 Tax=Deinococcus malanensis TaxID=1706855 RepID=A0ABQ2EFW9_9DEIO|nr:MFS transporter [Deinococcus malanensis]GGK10940.1 MFS transporter [Deinococcus malanensis]